jgi:hypothetical protein
MEPLMYRILSFHASKREGLDDPSYDHPLRAPRNLKELKPAEFFCEHVRHVSFMEKGTDSILIDEVLSVCASTVDLVLYNVSGDSGLLPPLEPLPLQRLAIEMDFLARADVLFTNPLFAHITHLTLIDWREDTWAGSRWSGLALMPRLTHLAFLAEYIPEKICQGALLQCSLLEVLVLAWSNSFYDYSFGRRKKDARFVVLWVDDFRDDWENGARGRDGFWVTAEAQVRKQREGKNVGRSLSFSLETGSPTIFTRILGLRLIASLLPCCGRFHLINAVPL